MKYIAVMLIVALAPAVFAFVAFNASTGQIDDFIPAPTNAVIVERFPRSQIVTLHVPPNRLAVDLEIVGRKFYVLWNDGNVTTAIPEALRVEGDCPADINGDGKVGVPDMLILQAAWGTDCP